MENTVLNNNIPIPMLALRGVNVFPGMLMSFDVERKVSIEALNMANRFDRLIFLVAQKDPSVDIPEEGDLYAIGTVCRIRQFLQLPGSSVSRVMVEGQYRAKVLEFHLGNKLYSAVVEAVPDKPDRTSPLKKEALVRNCTSLYEEYIHSNPDFVPEQILTLLSRNEPGYVSDFIAQNVPFNPEIKQSLLEELNPSRRLEMISRQLNRELDIMSIEKELNDATNEIMQQNQRDYYLHEELKLIQEELGNGSTVDDITEFRDKIDALPVSEEVKAKLQKEVNHLAKEPYGSSEAAVVRSYLESVLEIPWGKRTEEMVDIDKARRILDREHYGLDKVKERILEYLAVKQLAPDVKGGLLCLVGPPGTGKTSVAMSIAKATNRKLVRISLGGVHDEAEIRGHRKTYIGSMPGRIMTGITQSGSCNPLMVLDEIDKLGSDYRGDPAAALLEVFDAEQNTSFRDNYLEIPFDLSDVFFITTANTLDTVPRALLDRMEVIELSSYTDEEKRMIAKKHLIPKQRQKHGLSTSQLKISDKAISEIIVSYTKESGVRVLERNISRLCRKAAAGIAEKKFETLRVVPQNLEELLGPVKFKPEELRTKDQVGLVRGLAWTESGGEVLDSEVAVVEGSGKLELTGNLGDVMKESAKAAVTYIRSRAELFGIDSEFYKTKDIHIHFPEGAVPKDGPSAGVTVTTAILSALSGIPVRHDVAMTGEITLRGRVLAIGGLKEKTMAALRNGVKTVIIPAENESDLAEIDPLVREKLEFVFAKSMDDVVSAAFRIIPSKENLCRSLTLTKSNLSNQQPIKSSSSHPATRL